jgi:hypothetical protein
MSSPSLFARHDEQSSGEWEAPQVIRPPARASAGGVRNGKAATVVGASEPAGTAEAAGVTPVVGVMPRP